MKMFFSLSKYTVVLALLAVVSCKKTGDTTPTPPPTVITVPDGFDYENSKSVNLDLRLLAPDNTPLANVVLNVYDKNSSQANRKLFTVVSDNDGYISQPVSLPSYLDTVVVDPEFVGLMHEVKVKIVGGKVSAVLGGSAGFSGNVIADALTSTEILPTLHDASPIPIKYLGAYDDQGVPKYLDKSESKLLEYVNASLPEYQPVPTKHPDYLNTNAQTNLDVVEKSDVWVTFVTEGAGYLNALAYYTYPTGKDPKTRDDIKLLTAVFPNASLPGSGGGLNSGSRVKIGTFDAGTSIGFALIANGWDGGSKSVTGGYNIFFSDDVLNPEKDAKLQRHTVLLYDNDRQLFLNGFEDQRRDQGSDNDFNDIIFYAKSNPVTGISKRDVNPIDQPIDSDGDGVSDVYDKFPKDPTRAYIAYLPDESNYGTLAYEDLWPSTGDYDMNDLVVNYRYALIKNAANKTVEIRANYAVAAIGASNVNGFGVQFPFAASLVQSVSGGKLTGKLPIKKAANGVEAGQVNAVIIPFDNAFSVVNRNGGFVNTISGTSIVSSDTLEMLIVFAKPLDAATVGTIPFNPFLIVNGNRGKKCTCLV
jgi:hypothetical protein